MNFISKKMDPSETIKKYCKEGDIYFVQYMDETWNKYFCSSNKEEQRLQKTMLDQALKRQSDFDEEAYDYNFKRNINLINLSVSALSLSAFVGNNKTFVFYFTLCFIIFNIIRSIINTSKIRELKKYKLFFELYNELDKINNSKLLKELEFDNFHREKISINTLDNYSYGDIKYLYKSVKK